MISRAAATCGLLALLSCAAAPAAAQMYHLYLDCKGRISAGNKSEKAYLQLALRDNNNSALVQRSNVLPVGEIMKYTDSATHYAMAHTVVPRVNAGQVDWYGRWFVVWYPALQKLKTTRLSIDRNSGDLEGEMVDSQDAVLGRLQMNCEPMREEDAPKPRF
jgi:hypothetical protein